MRTEPDFKGRLKRILVEQVKKLLENESRFRRPL